MTEVTHAVYKIRKRTPPPPPPFRPTHLPGARGMHPHRACLLPRPSSGPFTPSYPSPRALIRAKRAVIAATGRRFPPGSLTGPARFYLLPRRRAGALGDVLRGDHGPEGLVAGRLHLGGRHRLQSKQEHDEHITAQHKYKYDPRQACFGLGTNITSRVNPVVIIF